MSEVIVSASVEEGDPFTALDGDNNVAPWLVEALRRAGREVDLSPYLTSITEPIPLADTRAVFRCHLIPRDGNGAVRTSPLIKKLVSQVLDYCIPRSRIIDAQVEYQRTGATEKLVRLSNEARSLFTTLDKSGEGGELLLYALLEYTLGLPQVLCKMSLKTNPNVHFHGVDGVHAGVSEDGNLTLYWGEAKMYQTVNDAVKACIESIAAHLLSPYSSSSDHERLLLRNNVDAGNAPLSAAIARFMDDDNHESQFVELRGGCLVGFDLDEYPDFREMTEAQVHELCAEQVSGWAEHYRSRIDSNKLTSVVIEAFCVPLPSVKDFRAELKQELGL